MRQEALNTTIVDLLNRFLAAQQSYNAEIFLGSESDFLDELTPEDLLVYQESGVTWREFVGKYVHKTLEDSFLAFLSVSNRPGVSPNFFRHMVATDHVQAFVNGVLKPLHTPEDYFDFYEEDKDLEICFPTQ
jgi:hypothetical protein